MDASVNLSQYLNLKRIRFLRQIYDYLKIADQNPIVETSLEPYAEYQRDSEIIREYFRKFRINQDIEIGYLERHSQTGEIIFDSIQDDKRNTEKFTLLNFSLHIQQGTILLYPEINELVKDFNYSGSKSSQNHSALFQNHGREDHLYSFWKHSFKSGQSIRFVPSIELKLQGIKEFSINDSLSAKFMEQILSKFESMDSYFLRLQERQLKSLLDRKQQQVLQNQDHKEQEVEYANQISLFRSVSNSLTMASA